MKIEFSAEIEVPDDTPLEDVERWLEFQLGARASLAGTNALVELDMYSVQTSNVWVRSR